MRCRACKCSEREPCDPPCGWFEPGLCTTCADAAQALLKWKYAALRPNGPALLCEVKRMEKEAQIDA
jgi:hypothetical protein